MTRPSLSVVTPCHSPHGGVAQPVAVVEPVRSVRGVVEGDQGGPVRGRIAGGCAGGDVRHRPRSCGVDGRDPVVARASRRQAGVGIAGGGIARVGHEVNPSGAVLRHFYPVARDGRSTIAGWRTPRQVNPGLPVPHRRQSRRRPRAVVRRRRGKEVEGDKPYHVAPADDPISLTKEVVVYGRYDLSPLDHAVTVGVVPGDQGVPGGNRYRDGAAYRNFRAVGVRQNAGERVGPLCTGCGNRIGKIGFPEQAEGHLLAVDRYRRQAAGNVAEPGRQGFHNPPKRAVSAGGDRHHHLPSQSRGRRGEGPDGPPGRQGPDGAGRPGAGAGGVDRTHLHVVLCAAGQPAQGVLQGTGTRGPHVFHHSPVGVGFIGGPGLDVAQVVGGDG